MEAFGDREAFFNVCVTELEKAEIIVEQQMGRAIARGSEYSAEEPDLFESSDDIPETQEDKIKVLLDIFKEKDLLTLTKYIKVFTQGKNRILGVAHTKLNTDFAKVFKKLNLVPDDDDVKHVKSFTKPSGEQMSGKNTMVATCCKIFHLKKFSKSFREMVLTIFNMDYIESEEEDSQVEDDLAASQDYPQHTQSRTSKTLKICTCCKFKSRDNGEFEEHMELHSKCPQCGLYFGDNGALEAHHTAFHAMKACEKCGKEMLESKLKKHMNGHEIQKGFKKVVSKGKVKANSKSEESEPKVAKVTGYRLFLQTKRPEIRSQNPDATPQEMIKLLNEAWNREKASGNKAEWDKKAKNDENNRATANETDIPRADAKDDNHAIKKCGICGLMIANLNAHMMINHRPTTVEPIAMEEIETDVIEEEVESSPVIVEEVEASDAIAEVEEGGFQVGDLVMVMRKTLHWPGKVLRRNFNLVDVMIFDKARTQELKQPKFLLPFTPDLAACEGRGAVWVKAWKEAKKEYEEK